MDAMVIGPISSGNRLLVRILEAAGLTVDWDRTHGEKRILESIPKIVIHRDKIASEARRTVNGVVDPRVPTYDQSMSYINDKYADALWIRYEDLCADLDGTISILAEYLGIPTWTFDTETISNRNGQWTNPEIEIKAPEV